MPKNGLQRGRHRATPATRDPRRQPVRAAVAQRRTLAARSDEIDYRKLLESVHAIVWRADARTFQTTFASKEAEDILGYRLESWRSVPGFWLDHVHPDDRERVIQLTSAAIAEHRRHDFEYRMIAADGRIVWLRNIVNVVVERGKPKELIGISVDITERKRAEVESFSAQLQLRRVARAAALGELAAALAHELNQPLAAIVANAESAQLSLEQGADRGAIRSILDEIHSDAERAGAIVHTVAGLVAQQPAELMPVDPAQVFAASLRIIRPLLTSRGIELVTRITHDLPVVRADKVQLQQVLLNLILNAVDAMASSALRVRRLTVRAAATPDGVEAEVEDTGTGIPPDLLPRVFEPFWTTKTGGVGVGLAICNRIIEAHGGTLDAANNSLGGATFRFTLPSAEKSEP